MGIAGAKLVRGRMPFLSPNVRTCTEGIFRGQKGGSLHQKERKKKKKKNEGRKERQTKKERMNE